MRAKSEQSALGSNYKLISPAIMLNCSPIGRTTACLLHDPLIATYAVYNKSSAPGSDPLQRICRHLAAASINECQVRRLQDDMPRLRFSARDNNINIIWVVNLSSFYFFLVNWNLISLESNIWLRVTGSGSKGTAKEANPIVHWIAINLQMQLC